MKPSSLLPLILPSPATSETLLYSNPFNTTLSVSTWIPEGPVTSSIANNTLTLSSPSPFVLWLPDLFPDRIRISFSFSPVAEPGLAMLFFGAASLTGGSIFDKDLSPRNGSYAQYHSGDIRTLHASYFRRRWPDERAFHLANLRKSPGFHLVAQGADPIPDVVDADGAFYRVDVVKDKRKVSFSVNGLLLFAWEDVNTETGPVVRGGRIGFRQMDPLVARYRNLEVWKL